MPRKDYDRPKGGNAMGARTGAMPSGGRQAAPTFYKNGHAYMTTGNSFVCATCGQAFDRNDQSPCSGGKRAA